MPERLGSASPELYLVGSVLISLAIAGIISQIPAMAFGGFHRMAIVLVLSDLVLYILMKLGMFKGRDRGT